MKQSIVAISIAASLLMLGCSDDTYSTPKAGSTNSSSSTAQNSAKALTLSADGFFVDSKQMSLYTFDNDTDSVSNCVGECEVKWPVFSDAIDASNLPSELNAEDFSTITRADGSTQVTFKKQPLYYFAGDTKAGDITGDNVKNVWHLVYAIATNESVKLASGANGNFLVDEKEMSLYTFDKDTSAMSNCYGDCEAKWPVFSATISTDNVANGIDATKFDSITRDDGNPQSTYNNQPLYYFAGDTKAGDTTGDNVKDVWHLVIVK